MINYNITTKDISIICAKVNAAKGLTIGKTYKVVRFNKGTHMGSDKTYFSVWIINDDNIEKHYSARRFVSTSLWREKQLEEILK